MKRAYIIALSLLFFLSLGLGASWYYRQVRGPTWEGKNICEWMWYWMHHDGTNEIFAIRAFQGMGSNAVPTLIRLMEPGEKGWVNGSVWVARMYKMGARRKGMAVKACGYIGPEALPALPHILRLLDLTNHCGDEPLIALYRLGSPGIQVLTNLLAASPDSDLRHRIAYYFKYARLDPPMAASGLLLALKDTDPRVRKEAVWSLGILHANIEETVPAIANCLGDPSNEVQEVALSSLEYHFGPEAKPAVPRLIEFIKTNKTGYRVSAHRILLKLDPDAANQLAPYVKDY